MIKIFLNMFMLNFQYCLNTNVLNYNLGTTLQKKNKSFLLNKDSVLS